MENTKDLSKKALKFVGGVAVVITALIIHQKFVAPRLVVKPKVS